MNIQYRSLSVQELNRSLFGGFIRRQVVTKCRRKEKDGWVVRNAPFIDDWTEQDYQILISCLKNTLLSGGFVHAAFSDGILKGFVSVEPDLFGGDERYLDLSSIHVSADFRNLGIGTALFGAAKAWAKAHGARKLYISSHSAVESQAFYQKLGCVEAVKYHQEHVDREPYDCQLEYVL